ncbi:MAG: transglycosylase domain-containing protein [Leptospiraceae bacterium]|nr:transglycosylase domain-containing protein [Leptospiraceae bacterium]MCP5512767.1 transglycosylase domain-containing protein [Leptospiraceae bacterium]
MAISPHTISLSEDGSFTCPNCKSRSKIARIPEIPGIYKITCYKCKHQVLHRIEEKKKELEMEATPVSDEAQAALPEDKEESQSREQGVVFREIHLGDAPLFKTKSSHKPILEVKKITIPGSEKKDSNPGTVRPRSKNRLDTVFYYLPPFFQKKWLLAMILIFFFLVAVVGFPLLANFKETQSRLGELLQELGKNKPSVILDREGNTVSEIYQKKTGTTKLNQYPGLMIDIILNVEDRGFFDHGGIDILALARATIKNVSNMRYTQGASTITQQLARILIKDRRKSLSRKIREAMVAMALEKKLSKDEILEAYLNQVYLGHGAFGIENAASYYFDKKLNELNTMEMVLLSSLASAPNKYSPFKNPALSKKRVKTIMRTLISRKIVSENYYDKIEDFFANLKEPPYSTVFGSRYDAAPYVTEHVREILKSVDPNINIYDVGGYSIETTLIKKIQEFVPEEITAHLFEMKTLKKIRKVKVKDNGKNSEPTEEIDVQAAVIGLDPATGEVLFMHGGGEEFHAGNQFNRAIQMRRQTGSAIKPILYSAAVDLGIIYPGMKMLDTPLVFRGAKGDIVWSPDNFGQVYEGEITIREALAKSKNTIAVQIGEKLGIPLMEKYYTRYFFPDHSERSKRFRHDLSISLGSLEISPLEMASAFSAFANDGKIHRPYLVKRIYSAEGRIVYNYESKDEFNLKVPEERRVISPDSAEIMVSIMRGSANASGIRSTGFRGDIAGKTGTTNDQIDAWFVGVKPGLSMAIWVGFDDASYGMGKKGMGAELAAPLWGKIGKKISEKGLIEEGRFNFSKKAVRGTICKESGLMALESCPEKVSEIFPKDHKIGFCKMNHGFNTKEILNNVFP